MSLFRRSFDTPVNPSDGRVMRPTLLPVGLPMVKVSDCVGRPTLLVSKCIRVSTLSKLKTDDTAISQTLLSVGRATLQGSEGIGFSMVYVILVGISEGITIEYATQWSVGASTLISRLLEIRRYATDGKKKVYVSNTQQVSVEFETW